MSQSPWRGRSLNVEPLEDRRLLTAISIGNGNEPFIVVDPFNPDNVAVGWNFGVAFSTDGGETFTSRALPAGYRGDPGLAVDGDGRAFFSYLLTDSAIPTDLDIGVSTTNFTLQNFAANQVVVSNPDNAGNTGDDDDKELIVADHFTTSPFRNNVYTAWRELNNEEILFSRSTDNGATFSAPISVATSGAFNTVSAADPEVGPNGEVYVGYWQGNTSAAGTVGQIRVVKSTDGGVTFGAPASVSLPAGFAGLDATLLDHGATPEQTLPNQNFKIVSRTQLDIEADPLRAGNVYAIWATDPDGTTAGDGANVVFSRSTNGGASWGFPTKINDDGGALSQFMPSISVDEAGNLVAIWYDERISPDVSDPRLSIHAAVSIDGGLTWSPNFLLDGSTFDPDVAGPNTFIGDYIKVAAADGTAYATWVQTDGGGTNEIRVEKFSILGAFADRLEPNNHLPNATVLGSLPKITLNDLTIHDEDDNDWFKITAHSTGKMIINAYFDDEIGDIDIGVFDSAGNFIIGSSSVTDNEKVVFPVVSQEMYFLKVSGFNDDRNHYDLEIENFAVPTPLAVTLSPASDTGMMNNDNVTNDLTPTVFIVADLEDFASMGIDILTPAQAAAGDAGAAVEVYSNGVKQGVATLLAGTNFTVFRFTFGPGQLLPGLRGITAAVRIYDGQSDPDPANARGQFSPLLVLTLDTQPPNTAGTTLPDLLASSDSGMFNDDNVTNKMRPAFSGLAQANAKVRIRANGLVVGSSVVGSDSSDGVPGNGLGAWEITSEPLDDDIYTITAEFEDAAGNIFSTTELLGQNEQPLPQLVIEIDTTAPNTPFLDLLAADDSGRSNEDNITNDQTPRLDAVVDDPNGPGVSGAHPNGHLFNNVVKYRIFDRIDTLPEALIFNQAAFVPNGGYLNLVALINLDGRHGLKLEVEDRAGNLSHDFLMDILLDRVAPANPTIAIDPASTDTGVPGQPFTFQDRITSDSDTGFVGTAEADAIVRMWADGVPAFALPIAAADNDVFQGLTVAVPLDGNQGFPQGQWRLAGQHDLNNPNFFPLLDGVRQISVTAEDVAGNESSRNTPGQLDIFIDTRGPQVDDVYITDHKAFDLFDVKPDVLEPTPLVFSLDVDFVDQPTRVNGAFGFVYPAVNTLLAGKTGNYTLVGDATGTVSIVSAQVNDFTNAGGIGRTTVTLHFAKPLPDDRYTLMISDRITDDAGNALDGETSDEPLFRTGDGSPGGKFTARFTVDSRPEIGTFSSGTIAVDINGNFIFDPQNVDQTNRDIVFDMGFASDVIFAGNFDNAFGLADGFDKLGAYGLVGSTWRWLIDTDNDGVPNLNIPNPVAIDALPVAGEFNAATAGDEVGLFTGKTWYFDLNGDNVIDAAEVAAGLTGNMRGYPIVGDFDGDGHDDLGTWQNNRFFFDLTGAADGTPGVLDGFFDDTIDFGFEGVNERPVAADMDGDGIDDVGLWVPGRSTQLPGRAAEWYFLVSDDFIAPVDEERDIAPANGVGKRIPGTVNTLKHPFTPEPFAADIFAQFGDEFAIPIVGNFDPPGSSNFGVLGNWLTNLYRDMLGRAYSVDEFLYWDAQLDNGAMTPTDVAYGFLHSRERRGAIIGQWYQKYLGRDVEAAGLSYWLDVWAVQGQDVVEASLIGSPEFYQFNGGTDAGWVQGLYRHILGRDAVQSEVDYWTNVISSGADRTAVAMGFLTSDEYRLSIINGWYQDYLRRDAESNGAQFWLQRIKQGLNQEQIQAGILASPEFQGFKI